MSFLKITDPSKREAMIKDFIETRKRIKDNFLAEKVGEIGLQSGLIKLFKPVTETQKATTKEITEGLKPIKEGIEKIPRAIPQEEDLPPPYEPPFADEYEVPGEVDEVDKEELGETNLPNYIRKTEDGYLLGNGYIYFDKANKKVLDKSGGTLFSSTKIYDILTNKKSNVTWDDLDEEEKKRFAVFILMFRVIQEKPGDKPRQIGGHKKWDDLYSHIWHNRFYYIPPSQIADDEELIREAFNLYKKPHAKTTSETKERIKWVLKIEDVDFDKRRYKTPRVQPTEKTGSGLTILPSDPNALLERLDLLLASQNAGHSNVRNELVSICDELKRQGAINANEYKKLNSVIKK